MNQQPFIDVEAMAVTPDDRVKQILADVQVLVERQEAHEQLLVQLQADNDKLRRHLEQERIASKHQGRRSAELSLEVEQLKQQLAEAQAKAAKADDDYIKKANQIDTLKKQLAGNTPRLPDSLLADLAGLQQFQSELVRPDAPQWLVKIFNDVIDDYITEVTREKA